MSRFMQTLDYHQTDMSEPSVIAQAPLTRSSRKKVITALVSLTILGGLLALLMVRGCYEGMKHECRWQWGYVALRCRMHAAEHNGQFPNKWSDLKWDDLDGTTQPRQFVCPVSGHGAGSWAQVDFWADYRLIPGRTTNDPPNTILAIELLSNHKSGANVLFVDGSSTWLTRDQMLGNAALPKFARE